MKAYFLPVGILFAVVNNGLVIYLLQKDGPVRHKIGKTVRIYYMAMAVGDMSTALAFHLAYFLGVLLNCLAVLRSHTFKYEIVKCHRSIQVSECMEVIQLISSIYFENISKFCNFSYERIAQKKNYISGKNRINLKNSNIT